MRFLLLLAISAFCADPLVNWMPYAKAVEQAKKDSMFVFVDVYADWCVPCKVMDKTTFRDSAVVAKLNRYFYASKLNAESDTLIECNNWPRPVTNCVMENWKLVGVPSLVLIGPSGNHVLSVTQALDPEQMILLLNDFIENRKILLESDRKAKESSHGS